MSANRLDEITRRAFLRRGSQLAATGAALPLALNLAAVGDAAALEAQDYKALVCVFLNGGNDHDNTVVPFDAASHQRYAAIRQGLALQQSALAATVLNPRSPLSGGRQYALHPRLQPLVQLFDRERAAVLLNIGPLVAPTTRQQFTSRTRLPPKLFSHNDQVQLWLSQNPEGATVGWGGRIGELALASNGQSMFTCISTAGHAVFLSGDSALQYKVGTNGPTPINALKGSVYGSTRVRDTLRAVVTQAQAGMLADDYNRVTARAIDAEASLGAALAGVTLRTTFPATQLGSRMRTIARIIGAHRTLGVKRQVFMTQVLGCDLHSNLLTDHGRTLGEVADAVAAFYTATEELGLAGQVTTFTGSEFGRTLSINTTGSDHGWGSHHFVVGGGVKGRAFYGTPPPVSIGDTSSADDQWHVGQGRLLPTMSTDQLAATLGRWFGASPGELDLILPSLRNFDTTVGGIAYPRDLGFLA